MPRFQDVIARYNGQCAECRRPIARNAPIVYDGALKWTLCKECGEAKKAEIEGTLFAAD